MKSKKSIFVVALAALMLIVFTACEQPANIWNPNGKIPTALNITQNEPFVEGQLFDASKFSVEVVYQDGSKETTTSANVTLETAAGSTSKGVLAPGAVVSASLTTVGANAGSFLVSNSRTIDVRTIDSVTVVAPATLDQNAIVSSVAVKSLFTVTANYEGGSVDVKPSEFDITGLNTTTAAKGKTGTIEVKFASENAVATSDTFTIDIVEKDSAEAEWDGTIAIRVKEDKTPAFIQRAKLEATAINNVYEVVKNMDDGTTVVLDTTELAKVEYTLDSYYTHTGETDIKRFPVSGTVTLTATYNYADPDTKLVTPVTATIPMNLLQDYPKSYSAKSVTAGQPGSTNELAITVGQSIAESYFTVTATWASGLTGVNLSVNDFDVAPGTAPTVDAAKQVPVTLKWLGDKYSDLAVDPEVQVWVKPSV